MWIHKETHIKEKSNFKSKTTILKKVTLSKKKQQTFYHKCSMCQMTHETNGVRINT